MPTEADIRLKKSLKTIGLAPFKSKFWKGLSAMITLLYAVTLWPFSVAARELLFVGRGDRLFTMLGVLFAAAWIFAIAVNRQDLAGDALFLVGAYLLGKWAIEVVARLVSGERAEDEYEDGESICAIAGVRNAALTLSIGALFGLALWPFPIGELVGPLLALGCTAAILSDIAWNLRAAYRARERRQAEMTRLRGELSEKARKDNPRTATFQRVEID